MSVKIKLDAIEQIVKTLESSSELERFQSYATIKVLTDELAEYAESTDLPHGLIREKITELLEACRRLAYLSDRGTRDDSWYISEAYGALQRLASVHCFNIRHASS